MFHPRFYFTTLLLSLFSCNLFFAQQNPTSLKVLQFNIWQEGTIIPGGFDAIIDEVLRSDADLIALSEVRNYKGKNFAKKLVTALAEKGQNFYSRQSEDSGILSRYPIVSQEALYPVKNDHGSITKAIIDLNGTEIAFYSAHLDYLHCSIYLPRGYDSSTWEKLPAPVTDSAVIAADNRTSERDEAIDVFIKDAKQESAKGRLIIIGGDFNEASHQDWIEATKYRYDHNGVVMLWRNTLALEKAGFKDAYREIYPNPLTHPGFTFPADNPLVNIEKLAWAPDADDRDRIDFIFYLPSEKLRLKDSKIIGPKGSIVRNQRVQEQTQDPLDQPIGVWPTDHKAVWAVFELTF